MFENRYQELASKLREYVEEQAPQDPELQDTVVDETLHFMDVTLRENGNVTPGVEVVDDMPNAVYPTVLEASGKDPVYVGRIRDDTSAPNCLDLWVVADNIRKGAALNAVQIAETMIEMGLL